MNVNEIFIQCFKNAPKFFPLLRFKNLLYFYKIPSFSQNSFYKNPFFFPYCTHKWNFDVPEVVSWWYTALGLTQRWVSVPMNFAFCMKLSLCLAVERELLRCKYFWIITSQKQCFWMAAFVMSLVNCSQASGPHGCSPKLLQTVTASRIRRASLGFLIQMSVATSPCQIFLICLSVIVWHFLCLLFLLSSIHHANCYRFLRQFIWQTLGSTVC